MNETTRYAIWQEMFEGVLEKEKLDPRYYYERALPCFYLEKMAPAHMEKTPLGTSRIGGSPDLPTSISLPLDGVRAMTFLAQVNLGELERGFAPYLPQHGWLYFFIKDQATWSNISHRILYFDGAKTELRRVKPPKDAQQPEFLYQPYTISFRPGFTLSGDLVWDLFYTRLEKSLDTSVTEVIFRTFQDEVTRVGGHPLAFQPGSDFEAQRILSGEGHQGMKPLNLLFVLGSEEDMLWGDAGFLQFFVLSDDLAKCDFSHTYCGVIST